MRRRRLSFFAAVAALVAGLVTGAAGPSSPAGASVAGSRKVIANLFEWNWNSVARECRDFLGQRGYGYVQVSPPQEHVKGPDWWLSYQPVSYRIESRNGSRAQFQAMVDACHGAGVKVIVDAVINHMGGNDGPGPGWAGSTYHHYDYPGIYQNWDFHHCGRPNDDISNYYDRYEVQNCELNNLADLDTGSDWVRSKIAGYLNDLLSTGVDGFRIDAAKHIPAGDIHEIEGKLTRWAYIVQETMSAPGEAVQPGEYLGNGDVMEFRYGRDLGRVFRHDKLASLNSFGEAWGYLPGDQSNVFIDNHDTQRMGGDILTYKDGPLYNLANAFMLAWPYGSPTVMSSYEFNDPNQGPPGDWYGNVTDTTCFSGGWRCEHRWRSTVNMVDFHNVVDGAWLGDWYDNGNNHIAFGRGDKGYITINNEGYAINGRRYSTHLPAGRYCDIIHGDFFNGTCYGPTVTVDSNGWLQADVGAHDAVAIHVGARVG
jgi:alpha-amylase